VNQIENPLNKKNPPGKQDIPLPELADLKILQERYERENLVINLQGISPDHLTISNYMSRLNQVGLFKEIELIQSNESFFESQPMRVFRLKIVVKAPGKYVPTIDHRSTDSLALPIAGGFNNE
jgi:hypothetical protein